MRINYKKLWILLAEREIASATLWWIVYVIWKFEQLLNGDASRLICGKYILASLARYFRKKTNITFKEDDFRYYLVGEFDIQKLNFLKEHIISVVK